MVNYRSPVQPELNSQYSACTASIHVYVMTAAQTGKTVCGNSAFGSAFGSVSLTGSRWFASAATRPITVTPKPESRLGVGIGLAAAVMSTQLPQSQTGASQPIGKFSGNLSGNLDEQLARDEKPAIRGTIGKDGSDGRYSLTNSNQDNSGYQQHINTRRKVPRPGKRRIRPT